MMKMMENGLSAEIEMETIGEIVKTYEQDQPQVDAMNVMDLLESVAKANQKTVIVEDYDTV